jgi:hypothetical protein
VARVLAPHRLAHFLISGGPKTGEVGGDLQGFMAGTEQVENHGHACDSGGCCQAKNFLDADFHVNRELTGLATVLAVFEFASAPAGDNQALRGPGFQLLPNLKRQLTS